MALRKPVEQDQKGPRTTGAFPPPPELCNWIHTIVPFSSLESNTSVSFLAPSICPLTYPCCPRVWPAQRQQVPNCNEKSFSFSGQNKNLRHWKFHGRASAHEVSRPSELPKIQLSSNRLKANLNNIPAPNSAEFTSHYPSASAVLSPPALLTCMYFGGKKSGTAPDPFHTKVWFDLLHLLEMSQNITTSRHPRGYAKHLSV